MRDFLCKAFTPWLAADCFGSAEEFFDFLKKRNKTLGVLRGIFLVVAAAFLLIGYAAVSTQPWYGIAVGALVVVLGLSLVIMQNEKQLPNT